MAMPITLKIAQQSQTNTQPRSPKRNMKMKNLAQRITGSLALLTALIILTPNAGAGTPFTAGNIVVERVNGTTSGAQQVDVVEYNPSGVTATLIQNVLLPNAAVRPTGSPYNLMDGATTTSAGGLTRSANGGMIALPGYNGIPGDLTIAASASATISRVIGAIDRQSV